MKTVEIYSTPTCHFCHEAKAFLTEKGIPFVDYNVAVDGARRTEMVDMTGQLGVPVIKIDNDVIIGFNKPKVIELLDIK